MARTRATPKPTPAPASRRNPVAKFAARLHRASTEPSARDYTRRAKHPTPTYARGQPLE